jgi:hypothetical protein
MAKKGRYPMKRGVYGAVLAAALASVVFASSAAAGNPHGTPASAHVTAHASVHATLKTHGHVHATSSSSTGVHSHTGVHTNTGVTAHTHGNAHVQTTSSVGSSVNTGVKSSATTHFNTVASASSNQTKLYGNGMTAGQIALQAGQGSATLFGPGNSQAHLVLCGTRLFDVHALKAHLGTCAGTVGVPVVVGTTSTGTGVQPQISVSAGLKPSATSGFNTVVSASSNQTKLYGNGMTAGQIALLAGQGGVMLLGPGTSQAHLVLCGTHVFDVHALKAQAGVCTTGVSSTPTTIGATSSVTAPSASTSATTSTGASTSTSGAVTIKGKGHARGSVLGATASQTGSANASGVLAATAHRSTLPFTGLALGLPIGLALMLLVGGLGIRRAARSQTF